MSDGSSPTPFGASLRAWRRSRGLSQLALATAAGTTPRHLSFLETGRSRPGRDVILRLGECLALPHRERNALLATAGFGPAFAERPLDAPIMQPYLTALRTILDGHEPYPASALDASGRVLLANAAHRRLLPDAESLSAEASIDRFYGELGPARIVNWAELAWAEVERRRRDAHRLASPALHALADRAEAHLRDVPRPPPCAPSDATPVVGARWKHGADVLATFTAVLRFDTARDVTLAEVRVELIFPADEATAAHLRAAATGAAASR